jgi:hypothetical protein
MSSFFSKFFARKQSSSIYSKYFRNIGERPKYLQNMKNKVSFFPLVAVTLALPYFITPYIKKKSILEEQETGGDSNLNFPFKLKGRIEELKKHRQERLEAKKEEKEEHHHHHHGHKKNEIKLHSPEKVKVENAYKYILVGGGTASYAVTEKEKIKLLRL